MWKWLGAAALACTLIGAAHAESLQDAPLPAAISLVMEGGAHFVNDDGHALYTFDRDTAGVSNCAGQCATNWPPVAAAADAHTIGNWTPVHRADGTLQWAYKGKPIYTFRGDTAPGQTNGQGMGGVWHVVVP